MLSASFRPSPLAHLVLKTSFAATNFTQVIIVPTDTSAQRSTGGDGRQTEGDDEGPEVSGAGVGSKVAGAAAASGGVSAEDKGGEDRAAHEDSWMQHLFKRALANVTVTVENLVFKVHSLTSHPASPSLSPLPVSLCCVPFAVC